MKKYQIELLEKTRHVVNNGKLKHYDTTQINAKCYIDELSEKGIIDAFNKLVHCPSATYKLSVIYNTITFTTQENENCMLDNNGQFKCDYVATISKVEEVVIYKFIEKVTKPKTKKEKLVNQLKNATNEQSYNRLTKSEKEKISHIISYSLKLKGAKGYVFDNCQNGTHCYLTLKNESEIKNVASQILANANIKEGTNWFE